MVTFLRAGSAASALSALSCSLQVGHQVAVKWTATGLPAACAAAKFASVKGLTVRALAALAISIKLAEAKQMSVLRLNM